MSAIHRSPLPSSSLPCLRATFALFVLFALTASAWAQDESLGDYARRLRAQKQAEVLVSPEDGKRLFQAVDEIAMFASQDSGLPRLGSIKRRLIGRADAEKHYSIPTQDEAQREQRVEQAVVVLQKFGMLPTQFNLTVDAGSYMMNHLGGFYQPEDQTMYLLNWIAPEMQKTVMAHELTHARRIKTFTSAPSSTISRIAIPNKCRSSPAMQARHRLRGVP